MSRRAPGTGSVTQTSAGRWIARMPDGATLSTFESKLEASTMLDAALVIAEDKAIAQPMGGITLRGWSPGFLDAHEVAQRSKGFSDIATARSISRNWIDPAPFADLPMRATVRRSIEDWVEDLARRPLSELSTSYIDQILQILRKMYDAAIKAGVLEENPARGIKIPARAAPTTEPWTYLTLDEQYRAFAVRDVFSEHEMLMIRFAVFSGVREQEEFCLHDSDVHLAGPHPHITVRFGSRWRAPKGKRICTVPLLPAAIETLTRWYAVRDSWCPPSKNDNGHRDHGRALTFPGQLGGRLRADRFADRWDAWLKRAGIVRGVRWHDLRHTAGASLVSGSWGRAWRLEEVQAFLRHASRDETERYAHLAPAALIGAAAGTPGAANAISMQFASQPTEITNAGVSEGIAAHPEGSPGVGTPNCIRIAFARRLVAAVAGNDPSVVALAEALAVEVLAGDAVRLARQVAAGGPHAIARALDLAELVLSDQRSELEPTSKWGSR